jgi:hypothetical protein
MHSFPQALAFAVMAAGPLGLMLAENAAISESAAPKNSTAAKKSSTTGRPSATPSRKKSSVRKGPSTSSRQTWRPRQLQPTPERYKEIQQALVSKGYLSGEPSGNWTQESADALRRFQEDQNINPSGKIDSLSLIALGLGPKHGPAPTAPIHSEPKPENPPDAPAAN